MERWVVVSTLDELWEGDMQPVMLEGRPLLLCHVEGAVFAYDNSCPHSGNPLSQGTLEERVLTCAAHEWSFDVCTGRGINPSQARLHRYPVRLEGDSILVHTKACDE